MNTKLYALLLEDVQKDVELLQELLSEAGFETQMDVVETEEDYVLSLKRHNYDIIFADFTLPRFDGRTALELAKKICPGIPFICISGTIGEDKAVELLKQGATDYVLKDRMERLAFATRRALEAVVQLNKFRQTEIELQTNRRLLQTIINNALDAIYIKDIKGKYLLFNEAAEKAMGKKAAEVIGKEDTYFFPPEEAQIIAEYDRKVIESCSPLIFEETLTLADGKVHTFHTIKCPMFDDFGKPSGLFGIARDITERKQLMHSLILAKEKAEENDRLKTAFLNNISHEIRTPMNAIIGFADLLKEDDLMSDKRNHFVDIISYSCNQLLDIITDIVNISTLEAGQEKINASDVNINNSLSALFAQFETKAKLKDISFGYECFLKDIDSIVKTDKTKFLEILSNLIDNALKFTKQGHVNFGYNLKDNFLEFYIEDTGIGIPLEMQEIIFERFRQLECSATREFGGTGLGLSISKGYVELLGGKIWLNSEPDKGSTFYFTIPYNQGINPPSIEGELKNEKIAINKPKSILIAEDEDFNYMFIQEILNDQNINIIRATSGEEAVELCKSNSIDLVLMDLKIPIMDGFEATREIRKFLPNLPIIAQTAYTVEVETKKAFTIGCNDLISKPYKKEFLISKINEWLNK